MKYDKKSCNIDIKILFRLDLSAKFINLILDQLPLETLKYINLDIK